MSRLNIRRAVPSAVLSIALLFSAVFVGGAFAADGDSIPNAKDLNPYFGKAFTTNLFLSTGPLPTGNYYFRVTLTKGQVLGADFIDATPDPKSPLNAVGLVYSGADIVESVKVSSTTSRLTFAAPLNGTQTYTLAVKASTVGDFTVKSGLVKGTTLSGTSGTRVTAYSASTAIYADLKTGGSAVSGRSVVLESSSNAKTWKRVTATITHPVAGRYQTTVRRTTMAYYRFRFAGDAVYAPSTGKTIKVDPKAYLTGPTAKKVRGRMYSVSGYLKPRHSGSPVLIYARRYDRGRMMKQLVVVARANNYSSYSRYVASVALNFPGTWKLQAVHDDAAHAKTLSSIVTVTVR